MYPIEVFQERKVAGISQIYENGKKYKEGLTTI